MGDIAGREFEGKTVLGRRRLLERLSFGHRPTRLLNCKTSTVSWWRQSTKVLNAAHSLVKFVPGHGMKVANTCKEQVVDSLLIQ